MSNCCPEDKANIVKIYAQQIYYAAPVTKMIT